MVGSLPTSAVEKRSATGSVGLLRRTAETRKLSGILQLATNTVNFAPMLCIQALQPPVWTQLKVGEMMEMSATGRQTNGGTKAVFHVMLPTPLMAYYAAIVVACTFGATFSFGHFWALPSLKGVPGRGASSSSVRACAPSSSTRSTATRRPGCFSL